MVLQPVCVGHAAINGKVGGEGDGVPGTGQALVCCWLARCSAPCTQACWGTIGRAGRRVPVGPHAFSRWDQLLEPLIP